MGASKFAVYLMMGFLTLAATRLTAMEVGADAFRISHVGPDADADFLPSDPTAVYNSVDREYLIVWDADDGTDGRHEVYGQRIDAATGERLGDDFRISAPDDGTSFSMDEPAAAYDSIDNRYLVVWEGGVNGEPEICGQILSNTGEKIGGNFRISDMGTDGDPAFFPTQPAVAYNSTDNQYLVVWSGDDDTGFFVDNEDEIWGQRLGADGAEIGADLRISDMGPSGDPRFKAERPAVVYNSVRNEYLVVWDGDDGIAPLADNEYEVYGQRLHATGIPLGTNDFRISAMGSDGNPHFSGRFAAAAHDAISDRYLVVWQGGDDTAPLAQGEHEIFGQLLNGDASLMGDRLRLSDMGPEGDTGFQPTNPSVVHNPINEEFLVVWRSDDNEGTLVFGEDEIFGQRVSADGGEVGGNDFRITHMGPDGDANYRASSPTAVAGSETLLVIWNGNGMDGLADDEFEVFGTFLTVEASCVEGCEKGPAGGPPEGSIGVEQIFGGCSLVRR